MGKPPTLKRYGLFWSRRLLLLLSLVSKEPFISLLSLTCTYKVLYMEIIGSGFSTSCPTGLCCTAPRERESIFRWHPRAPSISAGYNLGRHAQRAALFHRPLSLSLSPISFWRRHISTLCVCCPASSSPLWHQLHLDLSEKEKNKCSQKRLTAA